MKYPPEMEAADTRLQRHHDIYCDVIMGSCWCCCIDCTENPELQADQNTYWAVIRSLIDKYGNDYWRLCDPVKIYYDASGQPWPTPGKTIIDQGDVWPMEDSRAK